MEGGEEAQREVNLAEMQDVLREFGLALVQPNSTSERDEGATEPEERQTHEFIGLYS